MFTVTSVVHEIFVGAVAGVPISMYLFSEAVKVLFVDNVTVPIVVEALNMFMRFVPS